MLLPHNSPLSAARQADAILAGVRASIPGVTGVATQTLSGMANRAAVGSAVGRLTWSARMTLARWRNPARMRGSEARRVFEYDVLFTVARVVRPTRLLFVGVAPYTRHYERVFAGARFETLDCDAGKTRFGSSQKHHVASATEMTSVVEPGAFDAVIFNGVYGWGVNSAADLAASLCGISHAMRDDAVLVFGWNPTPEKDPLDLDRCVVPLLDHFRPLALDGRHQIDVGGTRRHRFLFLAKR